MSALGQKQTYALQQAMSALHPIATLIASSEAPYKSGPSKAWLKIKNPNAPAATRATSGSFWPQGPTSQPACTGWGLPAWWAA